ncbi:hypothetical protein BJV78DRAFT_1239270 [Lactifluus subvellereus]|nr:hypothetical protein BJV78DRAFT_1239270 [Lactifluus subvellereus]
MRASRRSEIAWSPVRRPLVSQMPKGTEDDLLRKGLDQQRAVQRERSRTHSSAQHCHCHVRAEGK